MSTFETRLPTVGHPSLQPSRDSLFALLQQEKAIHVTRNLLRTQSSPKFLHLPKTEPLRFWPERNTAGSLCLRSQDNVGLAAACRTWRIQMRKCSCRATTSSRLPLCHQRVHGRCVTAVLNLVTTLPSASFNISRCHFHIDLCGRSHIALRMHHSMPLLEGQHLNKWSDSCADAWIGKFLCTLGVSTSDVRPVTSIWWRIRKLGGGDGRCSMFGIRASSHRLSSGCNRV